jgi:hypothetical protein
VTVLGSEANDFCSPWQLEMVQPRAGRMNGYAIGVQKYSIMKRIQLTLQKKSLPTVNLILRLSSLTF